MTQLEQIKAEIKKRASIKNAQQLYATRDELESLLSFIESLEKEKME